MDQRRIFSLAQVTRRIRDLLGDATQSRFWVRAHLVVGRKGQRAGHFYCELVEVDGQGRQVAKIDAVMWRRSYEPLRQRMQALGIDEPFGDNAEICAECSLDYHEVYGLKLQIHDVDPAFGEAEIERNRRRIVERLRADDLLEHNKRHVVPIPALRIGLVTAEGSAAEADFVETLRASGFRFDIRSESAAMQGVNCESEIVAALGRLGDSVDVICLVRGGGSQLDLASLDNERIARAVAGAERPVFVGLGHEIDYGVLDVVAHSSFKTPTAVAADLVRRVADLRDRLAVASTRLRSAVDRCVAAYERGLQVIRPRLANGVETTLARHRERLDRHRRALRRERYERRLDIAEQGLKRREQLLRGLSPDVILQRGYAIVRDARGRVIRSAGETVPGDAVRIALSDGVLDATIDRPGTTNDD